MCILHPSQHTATSSPSHLFLHARQVETLKIAQLIAIGSDNFLKSEYKALTAFVIAVAIPMAILINPQTMVCFIAGAVLSALSGYIGMKIATKANVRTTMACQGEFTLHACARAHTHTA